MSVPEWPTALRLDDRVAIVTGGGSGIGRAIAQTLAGAGAAVVIGDINDAWAAESCTLITGDGGVATHLHADVGRAQDSEALVAEAERLYGRVDILCNLGGPAPPFPEVIAITDEQLDTVLGTHLRSVIYGCRAAVPVMERGGGGVIVNMASTAADMPSAGAGLYTLAKTGVITLTRILALELGPRGIRVNGIAPGVTLTNYSRRHFTDDNGEIDEARREAWLRRGAGYSPLGLTGTPQDQAWLVLYLVSDAARFVTGQVIRANGGWSMV